MRVGFYQFSPEFGNKKANLEKIRFVLRDTDADLIVLPELFSTGYQFVDKKEVLELAEKIPDGFTTGELMKISNENNVSIVAGICERDDEKLFNSAVLVTPSGFTGKYRKTHLFFEEKLFFEPGDTDFNVFTVGGINIGIMVCFDWIFPEAARILSLRGADIIAHPSNLVLPYCQEAMKTRSIENSVFTITANRIGNEKRGNKKELNFTGGSQITGPDGEILLKAGNNEEKLGVVDIEPGKARNKKLNKYNDIIRDRKKHLYSELLK
ncbi:acyltransferase [candidate division KSB1 bacterium]|nr:MAG: acyltransferase [candidate division KSB1 bacterium]